MLGQQLKNGGIKLIKEIVITLRNEQHKRLLPLYIDVFNNSLSQKWISALTQLVQDQYHLEKNYCWLGWSNSTRDAKYICDCINQSIQAINQSGIGYSIDDHFTVENSIVPGPVNLDPTSPIGDVDHAKMNNLHRYFEDLQGVSGSLSPYYIQADAGTRWHIRQLNLLCHEYESLVLSMRKAVQAPEWRRPSQLMCWLNAPRFELEESDYELFGVDTINRSLGGVFVGVNKAVGKHHWEVFTDEGSDSRIQELTTSTLRSQTEAAGDFDIEWGQNPAVFDWQKTRLAEFRTWLTSNGFDPEDRSLTIGHPQVAQVNLIKSFGTQDHSSIWAQLEHYLNVYKIQIGNVQATYTYNWSDADYAEQQIKELK